MEKRERGLTLTEFIVVLAIFSFIMYSIYRMFVPGLKAWVSSDTKVRVQQNAIVALYRLTKEVASSNTNSISFHHLPGMADFLICFASVMTPDGLRIDPLTGAPWWEGQEGGKYVGNFVMYYTDKKSRLRRHVKEEFPKYRKPDGMAIASEIYALDEIIDDRDPPKGDQVVATDIENLQFLPIPGSSPLPTNPMKVELAVRKKIHNPNQEFRTKLETIVRVRYDEKIY